MRKLPHSRQQGFAILSYVLATVAILGATTTMLALSKNSASSIEQQWASASALVAQANLIRNKILDCAAQGGYNNSNSFPAYPPGNGIEVKNLLCPSTLTPGSTTTNQADWNPVFTGRDGVFVPAAPSGFNNWTYTNADGKVRIDIMARTPGTMSKAISSAASRFGTAAADSGTNRFTLTIVQ